MGTHFTNYCVTVASDIVEQRLNIVRSTYVLLEMPSDETSSFRVTSPVVIYFSDSEIVMVDLAFGDDFCKQNRSWDDFGTTISGI